MTGRAKQHSALTGIERCKGVFVLGKVESTKNLPLQNLVGLSNESYRKKNSRGSKEESTSSDCSLGDTWNQVDSSNKNFWGQ